MDLAYILNYESSSTQSLSRSNGSPRITHQKPFSCTVCEKRFARKLDWVCYEHTHTGIRPYICDWPDCKKPFAERCRLKVHRRLHTGEKRQCESCRKRFSDASTLSRHRRIHSGKKPYKCPYAECQKTFTRNTSLTRHQKLLH